MLRQAQHEPGGGRHDLTCHPNTPSGRVSAVWVEWAATDEDEVLLTFGVDDAAALTLPDRMPPARADNLWQTTCFEMFWQPDGGAAYVEFNFSPSLRWAAYGFRDYRDGMREQPMAVDPLIERTGDGSFMLEVNVDFSDLSPGAARVGLSAVIEELDGTKSYWALRHPPGKPDFHHPDCFALRIPALGRP